MLIDLSGVEYVISVSTFFVIVLLIVVCFRLGCKNSVYSNIIVLKFVKFHSLY